MCLFPHPASDLQIETLDAKHIGEHILSANKQTERAQFLPLVAKPSYFGDPETDGDWHLSFSRIAWSGVYSIQ